DREGNIVESQEVSFTVSEKEDPFQPDDDDEIDDDDEVNQDSPSPFLLLLPLAALAVLAVSIRKRD
ncbi:MAG: hypothetical protein JW939_05220, partial [Candidatus Thermoplasmatota archaeon]|nr:hypothetical protein [Candidatus Thermoplasmatota archaeon]